jgi:hypothetical protein
METRTNSPGVGRYRPKYETVVPRTIVTIFQSLSGRTCPRRKRKRVKLCTRLFRGMDENKKNEIKRYRKVIFKSPKLRFANFTSKNSLLSSVNNILNRL